MTLGGRLAAMRAELDAAAGRETFWARLKARLLVLEEGRAVLELAPSASRRNLAGMVHGGESAAMLDQVCGLAANATTDGRWVTGKAVLTYRAPTPGDAALICEARVVSRDARRAIVAGKVRRADAPAALIVARMTFVRLRETAPNDAGPPNAGRVRSD